MIRALFAVLTLALAPGAARADEAKAASESLYQLPVRLTDQAGAKAGFDVFRGHPVVVSMFYGSCPAACPMLVEALHRLEGRLTPRQKAGLRVLLVSFDPDRDTPAALSKMVRERGVDPARWKLAAAPEDEARELAALLGIKYRRMPDGAFDHTSVVALLDRDGVLVGRWEGLELQAETVARAKALLAR